MQDRFTIKIAGAAGQGIKSSGLIISKAAKRAGYYTFGYTEYPSLIRGGHNVYQIEISNHLIGSITKDTDVLLALNKESIALHIDEFDRDGGVLITDQVNALTPEQATRLNELKVKVYPIPLLELAIQAGGTALMKNTVTLGAVWKTLGLSIDTLENVIAEVFNKGEDIVEINKRCANLGYEFIKEEFHNFIDAFTPNPQVRDQLIITGNEALSLGAAAAGVKIYCSYPMTPASSILSNLAEWAPKTGMLVKQAEDEITAANMCVGANYAGTRALCGTSGGGLDLMSETISLAGITETPFVVILGQRHGAATGAPTWTGQQDLVMAMHTSHGEFPRIVMSCSDAEDAFYLIGDAFNRAERYQIPVFFLTEKYIAETTYTIQEPDQNRVAIDRGLVLNPGNLTGQELRYQVTDTGISARWFPGQHSDERESLISSTFLANSDEHTPKGYSTEDEAIIKTQIEKRMKKLDLIRKELPDPEVRGETDADITFITWGSNKTILEDAAAILRSQGKKVQIIHYTYLWPFKGEALEPFRTNQTNVYIVEQNYNGQLAQLIKAETGIDFKNKILRYDSRPFYLEDILETVSK